MNTLLSDIGSEPLLRTELSRVFGVPAFRERPQYSDRCCERKFVERFKDPSSQFCVVGTSQDTENIQPFLGNDLCEPGDSGDE